ncbi:hypothetical protein DFH07DRAFT_954537 [Mycena maculata]|uniref:Uncharacterized protein n=1 Tax=Mycena maculata TaxID=230809 RepID=A0AAD7HTS6_9AGAR|nr:hypothetical protein DFH07DRAFT_782294 [Mycena maculata]KAJ7739699.1 hypothetical protein DFH07DRAFT_778677 [Mycena maculata]KAJ7746171.1 hypothetical protein DFH07DRAFT_776467 [Mycena maculata]KAJ7768640.1 hypothetical protein DFH07DRAFT_954537 [Mycena maculata]
MPTSEIPSTVFPKTTSRKTAVSENSALRNQVDSLSTRVNKLEHMLLNTTKTLAELPDLYDRFEDMSIQVTELQSALLAATSGKILSDKDQQTVIHARDNNINSMLRAVLYSMMAISHQDTSVLPDPVFKSNGDPDFWVSTDIPDERVLRPQFTLSWTKNKPWHSDFVKKVRKDGHALYPSCSAEVIAGLEEKDILFRGNRTTFKHLKEKYQNQGRSDAEKVREKKFKRRDGRRTKKSKDRTAVRHHYPGLAGPEYDFVFHPAWQSTDCSTDQTSDSEPDDLEDDDTTKVRKLKSWPPSHRDNKYLDLVDDIDLRAKAHANTQADKKKKSTKQYIMVRAKSKLRPAMSIPRLDEGPKMLSCFINEAWLDQLKPDARSGLDKFVYGSEDEGYVPEWEEFPQWEKFDKKGKKKA